MYKVFINNTPLYLTDESHSQSLAGCFNLQFESKKQLRKIIHEIMGGSYKSGVVIQHYDINELYYALRRITTYVPAAGGIVENEHQALLFIFRKGKWDLPKGKMEKGERPDVAAIREVQEECGIFDLELTGQVWYTYHIYSERDKLCLKKTFWYSMQTHSSQPVSPQLEEDITQVKWMNKSDLPEVYDNTFKSIASLLLTYFNHRKSL